MFAAGGLGNIFGGLGNVAGGIGRAIAAGIRTFGRVIYGIIRGIVHRLMTFIKLIGALARKWITEGRKLLYQLMRNMPVGGFFGLSIYVTLCNAGVIPCNKPAIPVAMPMSVNLFMPPTPQPPPPPLEYTRPAIERISPQSYGLMSEVLERAGYTITQMCPWLLRRSRPRPVSLVSYKSDEFVVLTRKTTQIG
jgi:hypothetical protein